MKLVKQGKKKTVGKCDINFGELSGVYECLTWLKRYRYRRSERGTSVHFFIDSQYVISLLLGDFRGHKCFRAVQAVRRLAATMPEFRISLHWVPSHITQHPWKQVR